MELPYLLRVLGSLAAILILNYGTKRLTLSMVLGTVLIALWCGHSPVEIGRIAAHYSLSANSVMLLFIVAQVIWLSSQMSRTGTMKALVDTVKGLVSKRAALALLPAIIGLLPMPGGAIFSAPLVDDCDEAKVLSPLLKTQINYWFRHMWEYWWPLYPGVILAIEITGLSELTFVALQLPMSLLSVLSGYLFLLRRVPIQVAVTSDNSGWRRLLTLISPILLLIVVYTALKAVIAWLLPDTGTLPTPVLAIVHTKYFPMILAIMASQIYLQAKRPLGVDEWKKILRSGKTGSLVVLVLVITVYGAFIQANLPDGSRVMDHVREELLGWGIPLLLVVMCVPFIAGLTTGIAVGMVGAAFPVVIGLIGNQPEPAVLLSTTVLAYAFGYMGMILSPVHVCLIVTNRHFETEVARSLFSLVKPVALVLCGAILLFLTIRFWG